MIIAVIGANGFIGTRLVEMLHLGSRHAVVPIVRRASGLALPARFALDWRLGDALDVASLTAALDGCDAVVHTALGDARQIVAMPGVLCAAAAAAGIKRVVYLSSAAVHGPTPAADTSEATPLHCRHAMDYNNAKVRAERAFFRSCARHQLTGFALRPSVVFGPRSRWIADLATDLRQQQAWLLGPGDGVCNSIYVDNLVTAIVQALEAPASAAGPYLVGDREPLTWRTFYGQVASALGIAPATIHRLDAAPAFPRTWSDRIARCVASPGMQALLPVAPTRWKQTGKRLLGALAAPAPSPDSWSLPGSPAPRVTQELVLLQQNTWTLSSALARTQLGYQPKIDFPLALERSLAWLAFAEGRT